MKTINKNIRYNIPVIIAIIGSLSSLLAFIFALAPDFLTNIGLGISGSLIGALTVYSITYFLRVLRRPVPVFISYSHKDFEFVIKLAKDLKSLKLAPIIDRLTLNVGDDIRKSVEDMINQSDYFIIVISGNSADSLWMQKEIEIARERHKLILPVVLDRDFVPDILAGLFYADFSKNYDQGLTTLKRTLMKERAQQVHSPNRK